MKYQALILSIVILYSCAKKDTNVTPSHNINVLGTWRLTKSYDDYKSPNTFVWNNVPDSVQVTVQFFANSTYLYKHNNYLPLQGTYTVSQANRQVTLLPPSGGGTFIFFVESFAGANALATASITMQYVVSDKVYKQQFVRE